jgi:hypothetical protein
MALASCHECGRQISSEAKAHRHFRSPVRPIWTTVDTIKALTVFWVFLSLCSPAGAQHPPGWVACEFKWQDAGKPADYKGFMDACVRGQLSVRPEAAAPRDSSLGAQQVVLRTSCHMDSCFWLDLETKTILQAGLGGNLVKVRAKRGESFHPQGSYETTQPIQWKLVESYVFCSTVRPAVLYQQDNTWFATFLAPGNPIANPGSAQDALVVYFFVCHDLNFAEKVISDEDVASLGYPASLAERAGDQERLTSPTDILDAYRTITFQDFKLDGKDLAAHHSKIRLQGFYKKFGDLDTLQSSALAVAAAREYGSENGVPLLTDDATRTIRAVFLECGDNPMRPLGCPVVLSGHADVCTVGNLFTSKSVPCLVVEDGN